MIRLSSEAKEELYQRMSVRSLNASFEFFPEKGSFQPVAEGVSLIEIIKEAEGRGYVPDIFNETAFSRNSYFTSGHLRCVKQGEEYPAVITSERVNLSNREVSSQDDLQITDLAILEEKPKENNVLIGNFIYRLYVVQQDELAS